MDIRFDNIKFLCIWNPSVIRFPFFLDTCFYVTCLKFKEEILKVSRVHLKGTSFDVLSLKYFFWLS